MPNPTSKPLPPEPLPAPEPTPTPNPEPVPKPEPLPKPGEPIPRGSYERAADKVLDKGSIRARSESRNDRETET